MRGINPPALFELRSGHWGRSGDWGRTLTFHNPGVQRKVRRRHRSLPRAVICDLSIRNGLAIERRLADFTRTCQWFVTCERLTPIVICPRGPIVETSIVRPNRDPHLAARAVGALKHI